ncbi:MAG: UvrB/UvrC motif-containing protein, partial [Bacteroidales bacterium]
REKQLKYNEKHNITPSQIIKAQREIIGKKAVYYSPDESKDIETLIAADPIVQYMTVPELEKTIKNTKKLMQEASSNLDFVEAARLRDEMYAYEKLLEKLKQKNY